MTDSVLAPTNFSPKRVNWVLSSLMGTARRDHGHEAAWLEATATRVHNARPDLWPALRNVLGTDPRGDDLLAGLSIGEISVCYEALSAALNASRRKSEGQYYTPDDAAEFMAEQTREFPYGVWLDPCCGVGNLAWHLANSQKNPADFIRNQLVLLDKDELSLRTAVALISASFADLGDLGAVTALWERADVRDFLDYTPLPRFDFIIMNPPYCHTSPREDFTTGCTRDLFAYFLERAAKSAQGMVAVTPASFLSGPKFVSVRDVLEANLPGGDVFVFDNVPDTLFRGYKYGSHNTSKTNFVRAAIITSRPRQSGWRITPILRWQVADRQRMFKGCGRLLAPRQIGPAGEWVKLAPCWRPVWRALTEAPERVKDLVSPFPTRYRLELGTTPRYYISASFSSLDRGSKAVLCFPDEASRDRVAVVLNSSIPYLWWRALDGSVTLPKRVLLSTPVPHTTQVARLVKEIRDSEAISRVTKLNAGRLNENIRHSPDLIRRLDAHLLPGLANLPLLYDSSMFA